VKTVRHALDDYLVLRRSLGFKLHKAGVRLPKFLAFMQKKKTPYITVAVALEWALQAPGTEPFTRLSLIRGFAKHLAAFDARTEVPPTSLLPKRSHRRRPYIYSDNEVRRLLTAAQQYPHDQPRGTYYCLLGLLSVSGLRPGEALGLRVEDVDLGSGAVTVRGAKFGKSRWVPLHPTTVNELKRYKEQRNRFLAPQSSPYFFTSRVGTRISHKQACLVFRRLSVLTGLRKSVYGRGPRLHDFRHRFAVKTLIDWYRAGVDVEHRLPMLSTFLGHVSVECTYWYLTEYPELMTLAVRKLNARWKETL
jgi:integrase